MKLLLTGANGLTGQKIVYKALKDNRIELLATSNGPCRIAQKQGYQYAVMDICKPLEVADIVKNFKPDVLINTAAMTNVDACELNHEGCVNLNIQGVSNLLDALKHYAPHCFFIHLSTDFIFDGASGPYDEEATPNPLSFYGESKLKAEQILLNQEFIKYAIIRTILVYGVVDNMSRSNIVLWAKQALENKQKINVVTDQFRTPTLAEDLAEGCLLAAKKQIPGIFNIGGKDFLSIYDLVLKVAEVFELDKRFITPSDSRNINQPAKRPPVTGLKIDKAQKLLGYEPHSIEEGLQLVKHQIQEQNNI